jgi:hypothetical protein
VHLSRVKILRGETVSKVTKGLSEGNDSKGVVLVLGEDQEKFLKSMGKSQGIGTVAVPRTSAGASSSAIRKMIDSGDEKALEKEYDGDKYLIRLAKVARKIEKNEFSEFDFTRCVRPNGTYYGTSGKCRKGKEVGQSPMKKLNLRGQELANALGHHGQIEERVRSDNGGSMASKKAKKELEEALRKEGVPTKKELKEMLRLQKEERSKKTTVKGENSLFSQGKDVDIVEVEARAEKWRKKAGLDASPGTVDWKHDRVHVLVHDFLVWDDKLGKCLVGDSKSPTPAEETLVNMVHRAASLKAKGEDYKFSDSDLAMYFSRDIGVTRYRNQIPKEMEDRYLTTDKDGIRRVNYERFIEKFREMEKTPGFEKLLDASHYMWTTAGDYMFHE